MSNKSNILLKILIVVALILSGLVFYSNKIIHEKPIHKNSIVVTSVVMPHPPLSDKRDGQKEEVAEDTKKESNESKKYVEGDELNSSSIELTPDVPKDEVEVIADDNSLDETEAIDDSVVSEELPPVEEPPLVSSDEVEVIENIPPQEQPNYDLGTRIGGDDKKRQNVDLGVQLF